MRRPLAIIATAVLAVALASCSPSEAPSEGSPTECGISSSSSVITDAVDALEPPSGPGTYWSYEVDSNYDPCADLSYALLMQQPQGNAQFGTQMLFFHKGEYIGIDSTHPQQVMDIEDHGNRLVVTYKDWKALEESGLPNAAAPDFTATVTFFWDNHADQLGTEGEFPNQGL